MIQRKHRIAGLLVLILGGGIVLCSTDYRATSKNEIGLERHYYRAKASAGAAPSSGGAAAQEPAAAEAAVCSDASSAVGANPTVTAMASSTQLPGQQQRVLAQPQQAGKRSAQELPVEVQRQPPPARSRQGGLAFVAPTPSAPQLAPGRPAQLNEERDLTRDLDESSRAPAETQEAPATRAAIAIAQPVQVSPLVARFQSRVGPAFELERVTCLVDGQPVYSGSGRQAELFQRRVPAGTHLVSVVAEYRGRDGIFSYASGYHFTVQRSQRVHVGAGRPASVLITAYEQGGPTQEFDKRLALAVVTR